MNRKRGFLIIFLIGIAIALSYQAFACDSYIDYCSNTFSDNAVYCLNASITNDSTCMYLGSANNVTLDCEGYSLTGDGGDFTDIGIHIVNSNNITVQNCTIDDFYYGTSLQGSTSSNIFINNTFLNSTIGMNIGTDSRHDQILNCTATGNSIGFSISSYNTTIRGCNSSSNTQDGFDIFTNADGSTMTDCWAYNNSVYGLNLGNVANTTIANSTFSGQRLNFDVWITSYIETDCNHKFENITGSGNRPIALYNSSISLSGQTFSELILCNADSSNVDSVTINGSSSGTNNALIARLTDNSNFSNITAISNNAGIWLANSTNNNIRNCTIRDSDGNGGIAFLSSSNNNTAEDNTMSNNGWSIDIENSDNNTVRNNNMSSSTHPIYIDTTQRTKIYNNTINSPTQVGIYLSNLAHLTEVIDNILISALTYAIEIDNSENCTITGNQISGTQDISIYIHNRAKYNTFTDNNVSDSPYIAGYFVENNYFYNTIFNLVYPTTVSFDQYSAEFNFTSVSSPASSVSYLRNISKYVNITRNNATGSMDLNISYSDVTIDTTNESNLRIYRHNSTDWELVSGSTVDTANDVVSANLTQFSIFGVFYNYSQCGNNITEPGESCDTDDLDSQTCVTQGFASGTISCLSDCSAFNTTNCIAAASPSGGGGGGGGTMLISIVKQCSGLPTTVTVTRKYPQNKYMSGVQLQVYQGIKKLLSARTNSMGVVEVTLVNPGNYTFRFTHIGYRKVERIVEIEECVLPSVGQPDESSGWSPEKKGAAEIAGEGKGTPADEEMAIESDAIEPEKEAVEIDTKIWRLPLYLWLLLLIILIIMLTYIVKKYSKQR